MSHRLIRVAELLQREVSQQLRARWGHESARITLTDTVVAPDLAQARIRYAVVGGPEHEQAAARLLASIRGELRTRVGAAVTLKRTPALLFVLDESAEKGMRIRSLLDDLDRESDPQPEA
jgi:ribosome-binding factor A